MKVAFTAPFKKDYVRLPLSLREQVDKQIRRLIENPRHPSLGVKKMEGCGDVLEARITRAYRMTFQITGDTYLLRRVGTHDILKNP
jgi:mRNA-degrading endonuclease RelE of RelBE toxin-antitoxin system